MSGYEDELAAELFQSRQIGPEDVGRDLFDIIFTLLPDKGPSLYRAFKSAVILHSQLRTTNEQLQLKLGYFESLLAPMTSAYRLASGEQPLSEQPWIASTISGHLAKIMTDQFRAVVQKGGGINSVELQIEYTDGEEPARIALQVIAPGGKAPLIMYREAVAERDRLKAFYDKVTNENPPGTELVEWLYFWANDSRLRGSIGTERLCTCVAEAVKTYQKSGAPQVPAQKDGE